MANVRPDVEREPTSTTTPQTHAQAQTQTQTQPHKQTQTFYQRLNDGERHWIWKLGLRVALLVFALIGIGCIAWAVETSRDDDYYFIDGQYSLWWGLITFSVSTIWCLVCLLVLFLRRPPRPVHPGVAVGLDLLLWLAYIPTILMAVMALSSILAFGSDNTLDSTSASGFYWHAPNGTWVYNATEYATRRGYTRSCDSSSYGYTYHYDADTQLEACAAQDAYVNKLWSKKGKRAGVETMGVVAQGIALLLHFALFVWACVDTHARNSRKTSVQAESLAADIVMKMVSDGAVVRAPGQQVGGYTGVGVGVQTGPYALRSPGREAPVGEYYGGGKGV